MLISELAKTARISAKTIRYYESVKLIPPAQRSANKYRFYSPSHVERLRFIASARSFGFTLAEIKEVLAARDKNIAPCDEVLETLSHHLAEVDQRISDLLRLRDAIAQIRRVGSTLPKDDVRGEHCVCYLIKAFGETGEVVIQKGEMSDV